MYDICGIRITDDEDDSNRWLTIIEDQCGEQIDERSGR